MKIVRNMLGFVNSLVVACGSFWAVFNMDKVKSLIETGESDVWADVLIWILLVLSLIALFLYIVRGSSTKGIVRSNEMGLLKINLHALEDMAGAEVRRIAGLKVIKTPVTIADKGVKVEIKVGVAVDEKIPDLALIIQRNVKETIEKTTDIPVMDVKVVISDVFVPTKARVE